MHGDNVKYRYLHIVSGQFGDYLGVSVGANGWWGGGTAPAYWVEQHIKVWLQSK